MNCSCVVTLPYGAVVRGVMAMFPRNVVRARLFAGKADFSVTVSTGTVALCGAMLLTLPVTNPLVAVGANGMFLSDYTLSLIGAVLIALALGLAQRVTLAWSFTLFLLSIAAVLTFLRGNMVIVPLMLGFQPSSWRLSANAITVTHACSVNHCRCPRSALCSSCFAVMVLATHRMPGAWWEMLSYQGLEGRRWIAGLAILLGFLVIVRLVRAGRVTVSSWSGKSATGIWSLIMPCRIFQPAL
jgi:phosphatidylglycerol lysyltransferase